MICLVVLLTLLSLARPQCSLTQTCSNPKDCNTCTIPAPSFTAPTLQARVGEICPNFKD